LTTKNKNWIDFFDDTIFEKEDDIIEETDEPSVESNHVE
jgi:hypothetical protein